MFSAASIPTSQDTLREFKWPSHSLGSVMKGLHFGYLRSKIKATVTVCLSPRTLDFQNNFDGISLNRVIGGTNGSKTSYI